MLYIAKYGAHTLNIPRNVAELPEGSYKLILRSCVNRTEHNATISRVTESMLLLLVSATIPNVGEGEFEYELRKGNATIGEGLLIIGNYDAATKAYDPEITYKQYEQ